MKPIAILSAFSALLFSCIFIVPTSVFQPQATEADIKADPDSARGASYLSPAERDVVKVLNQVRRDPKAFAEKHLASRRRSADGEECYQVLLKAPPAAVLKPSRTLSLAAQGHAADLGKTGGQGHTGSDGSSLADRIARHGSWEYTAGENCSYGYPDAESMVIGLLIDSGVPDRGHRKNILNPAFRYVGVGIRSHTRYGTNCVQDFAGGVDR